MSGSLSDPLEPVALEDVRIEDEFWRPRQDTNRAVTLERAYEQLEETGVLRAFRIAGDRR